MRLDVRKIWSINRKQTDAVRALWIDVEVWRWRIAFVVTTEPHIYGAGR